MNNAIIVLGIAILAAGIGGRVTVGFPFKITGSLGSALVLLGVLL